MPKRHTIHYSSENAPQVEDDDNLFVYYCKYSGRHALTTDVSLDTLPVRRTDGARVLDTSQHMVRMYLADGGPKLIKRKGGKVERQYRLVLGHLPLAYKVEEDGKLVYILPDAVTVFADTDGAVATEGDKKKEEPTPPCIARTPDGSSFVVMEVEDKAMKPAIVKINADEIRMHITSVITSPKANEELLEFFSKAIAMRLSQITLLKGQYTRRKHVLVKGLDPKTVYEKIQHAIDNGFGFETAVSRAPNYLQARRR